MAGDGPRERRRVHVAVAVVQDPDGQVLITRRAPGSHQGGLWEFPGGKVEPGEPVAEALRRELAEETGLQVRASTPLLRVPFDYPDKSVLLDVHHVRPMGGPARGCEGQPLRWVAPGELAAYPFPPANAPIVAAAMLPGWYAITPEPADAGDPAWWQALTRTLDAGARLIQYRVRSLDGEPEHAARVVQQVRDAGGLCLLNARPEEARELGADGLHLTARRLADCRERPPLPWVAASCHDAAELERACSLGVDFAVLGPVAATASHPGRAGIGWARFANWIAERPLPVYALGGVGPADLEQARQRRAQGVAGISAFWPPRVSG